MQQVRFMQSHSVTRERQPQYAFQSVMQVHKANGKAIAGGQKGLLANSYYVVEEQSVVVLDRPVKGGSPRRP